MALLTFLLLLLQTQLYFPRGPGWSHGESQRPCGQPLRWPEAQALRVHRPGGRVQGRLSGRAYVRCVRIKEIFPFIVWPGCIASLCLSPPAAGMDPYSRRSTWQILQNAREGRITIITTHFMDEVGSITDEMWIAPNTCLVLLQLQADILGDRICIMAAGRVACTGTSMFLKKRYGVGYTLTVVKEPTGSHSHAISDLIRSHVPEAIISTNVGNEITFRLPLGASGVFPAMLGKLEEQSPELGVANFGISVTTMEDGEANVTFNKLARLQILLCFRSLVGSFP